MARTQQVPVVDDAPVSTPRDEEVKPLPDDVDEDSFDEAVSKDPELEKDMVDGIDESNIIDETTRGAKPTSGSYKEPSDDVSDLVDE
ncbi:uncharacterized protein UV8b_05706 [Ustilaginoidea virens]|uniref:Uncharacterized protein n=1 Tax=Ustilaginoidea virens TaxID=1159556 RepID=A0A063C9Y3_USTVR|nr:uncharacterized protein UV8b_05706 [Ustilaginoidea virens]QUC21463.1 hypothetical protein UV8b_05706 [Ustilaginoidea virens]GAO13451.1 hypothetical protein UVI_02016620 [Ustilaginoidea virens]